MQKNKKLLVQKLWNLVNIDPSTKASTHKVEVAKIPGQVKRKYGSITRDIDKSARSFRQVTQKLRGEIVAKSGISIGMAHTRK